MNEHLALNAGRIDWPEPAPRFLRDALPPAPELPLSEVFGPTWAAWITRAAEAKSAPPDYVMAGLLAAAGSAIGNARWAVPWDGWAEPPIIWAMLIGAPSSNKSPGLDAVLAPLKSIERGRRDEAERELAAWSERAEVAKLAESAWREMAKAAVKEDADVPDKPADADPGAKPGMPCLAVTDSTVERLAVITAEQPRGTLMARDELAGWLLGMTRYAGGGSDRPFWLAAYGGRPYRVERMGRDPVHIDRLAIGVVGSIQPDRLRSLLIKSDDDGLLSRFLPVWPDPAPLRRPTAGPDAAFLEGALERLANLALGADDSGRPQPLFLPFTEEARDLLDGLRSDVRAWEDGVEGLLLSFTGKLPGFAVRVALVLAHLDWAAGETEEPWDVSSAHIERAAHFIEAYALPMAKRAYADASVSRTEKAARKLVEAIREHRWTAFASRDVLRLDRADIATAADLNPALAVLEDADVIKPIGGAPGRRGGRPSRRFAVNPAILGGD